MTWVCQILHSPLFEMVTPTYPNIIKHPVSKRGSQWLGILLEPLCLSQGPENLTWLTSPTLTLLTSYFVTGKAKGTAPDIDHLDFKIGVEPKDSPPFTVILVASSRQEKAAWTSDISQVSSTACFSEHIVASCLTLWGT